MYPLLSFPETQIQNIPEARVLKANYDIIISIIYTSLAPIFIPVESGKEFELGGLQDAAGQVLCVCGQD
jgi:hypothetical protein